MTGCDLLLFSKNKQADSPEPACFSQLFNQLKKSRKNVNPIEWYVSSYNNLITSLIL